MENLREDLVMYQNKYDDLLRMFKRTEDKVKKDEKEVKALKENIR